MRKIAAQRRESRFRSAEGDRSLLGEPRVKELYFLSACCGPSGSSASSRSRIEYREAVLADFEAFEAEIVSEKKSMEKNHPVKPASVEESQGAERRIRSNGPWVSTRSIGPPESDSIETG